VPEPVDQSRFPVPFDADARRRHREWVTRMAAGDAEALQLLYLDLASIVNGIVRRMLEDPEDAREAVQDTFVRAWRNAGTYHADRGEVVSWLVFIARHAAIDRLRHGARRRRLYEALQREPVEAVSPDPSRSATHAEVTQHLAALSPPQRRALELAFFAGCSQAQIAAAMQTPVGNVKNHLRRGLQKLRQFVQRHD
jgi:RNA polymerase sigma-70 factor (ECF subfamily)